MRRSSVKRARRHGGGLTVLTVLSIGGLACLLAGWNAHVPHNTNLSPAEVVALRFPDPRNDAWDDVADARAQAADTDDVGASPARADATDAGGIEASHQRADATAADDGASPYSIFSPYPTMAPPSAAPAAYQTASLASTPVELAPRQPTSDSRASAVSAAPAVPPRIEHKAAPKAEHKAEPKPVVVHAKPAPHIVRRPGAVLSDAQIASIKTRLHLTPDQQEMWPAVEAALRGLSYAKAAEAGRASGGTRMAEIDPDSDEVQRLKSAAFPLIMSFSDEQKHELRIIAHVAGLEKLAYQF